MNTLKTALISAAALCVAAPAMAGDGYKKDMSKTTMTTSQSSTMTTAETPTQVMGKVEGVNGYMHPSKVNDTVGEILQADGQPSTQIDQEIIIAGNGTIVDDAFRARDDDGMISNNAIVVPGSNGTLSTVTCPAGTTAQIDMTCLVTGDWSATN